MKRERKPGIMKEGFSLGRQNVISRRKPEGVGGKVYDRGGGYSSCFLGPAPPGDRGLDTETKGGSCPVSELIFFLEGEGRPGGEGVRIRRRRGGGLRSNGGLPAT